VLTKRIDEPLDLLRKLGNVKVGDNRSNFDSAGISSSPWFLDWFGIFQMINLSIS
jgi:hypothetical protein